MAIIIKIMMIIIIMIIIIDVIFVYIATSTEHNVSNMSKEHSLDVDSTCVELNIHITVTLSL